MNEGSPHESFDPNLIIRNLFYQKLTPIRAARQLKRGFERLGLPQDEAFERIRAQHQFFQEGNFPLTNSQMVRWDDAVICLESMYGVSEESRISRNRLVPIGTSWPEMSLQDISF